MNAYKSPDGRIRTDVYERKGTRFCVAELTLKGTLITEFGGRGEVTGQIYYENRDFVHHLASYLSDYKIEIQYVSRYEPVRMETLCTKCGNAGLSRELDMQLPERIREVPVMPIFVCRKCSQRHYSLTDEYLRYLVASNKRLFEDNELKEIDNDMEASINVLKEYIIRIFASKKISKIVIK